MIQNNHGLLWTVVALYSGAVFASISKVSWCPLPGILWGGVLLTLLVFLAWVQSSWLTRLCWFLVLFQFGGWYPGWIDTLPVWSHKEGIWSAQVEVVETTSIGNRYVLLQEFVGRTAVEVIGNELPWQEGDHLLLEGRLEPILGPANIGAFDPSKYWRTRGIHWKFDVKAWVVTEGSDRASVQNWVKERLLQIGKGDIAVGLLFGDRAGIGPEVIEQWQQLGISHMLAVSGMHMGILSGVVLLLIGKLPLSGRIRWLFLVGVLFGFVALIGFRPSALRAWMMLTCSSSAVLFRRSMVLLHHWLAAALFFFLMDPGAWQLLGVQMSFAASGTILLFASSIRKTPTWVQPLLVSLCAQLGLFPLFANAFGEWSVLGAFFTVILLPLVMAIMVGSVLWLSLGAIVPVFGVLLQWSITFLLVASEFFAPFSPVISLPSFSPHHVVLWYGALVALGWHLCFPCMFSLRRRCYRWVALILLFASMCGLPEHWWKPMSVYVIDVGQGDAILIRTPNGQSVLIDGGGYPWTSTRESNVGRTRVLPVLRHLGIDHIDLVVLTHPHEDHVQGLVAVLEDVSVGMVWDNGQAHTTQSYLSYLQQIFDKEIPYYQVRTGDRLKLIGGVELTVLHPRNLFVGTPSDLNNNSVVLLLEYQSRSMLFSGDLDLHGQMAMMETDLPNVDWLKVPHHGSGNAWYEPWYRNLAPRQAVISVGASNRFGHPSSIVMEGLKRQEVEVFRTDLQGMTKTYVLWGQMVTQSMR